MKLFSVTCYVEAEDAVQAVDAACDLMLDADAVRQMAALGEIDVRPTRKDGR